MFSFLLRVRGFPQCACLSCFFVCFGLHLRAFMSILSLCVLFPWFFWFPHLAVSSSHGLHLCYSCSCLIVACALYLVWCPWSYLQCLISGVLPGVSYLPDYIVCCLSTSLFSVLSSSAPLHASQSMCVSKTSPVFI